MAQVLIPQVFEMSLGTFFFLSYQVIKNKKKRGKLYLVHKYRQGHEITSCPRWCTLAGLLDLSPKSIWHRYVYNKLLLLRRLQEPQ